MNYYAFAFLAVMIGILWALLKGDYKQFSEQPDEEDELSKPRNWGMT